MPEVKKKISLTFFVSAVDGGKIENLQMKIEIDRSFGSSRAKIRTKRIPFGPLPLGEVISRGEMIVSLRRVSLSLSPRRKTAIQLMPE